MSRYHITKVTSGCSPILKDKFAVGPNFPTPSAHISPRPTSSVSVAVVKGSSHDHPVSPVGATKSYSVRLFMCLSFTEVPWGFILALSLFYRSCSSFLHLSTVIMRFISPVNFMAASVNSNHLSSVQRNLFFKCFVSCLKACAALCSLRCPRTELIPAWPEQSTLTSHPVL